MSAATLGFLLLLRAVAWLDEPLLAPSFINVDLLLLLRGVSCLELATFVTDFAELGPSLPLHCFGRAGLPLLILGTS